jgi:large subunit ribosomal protein L18
MDPKIKRAKREKRKRRVRGKVSGTAERPRLSVYRSLKHIYAQIIDDEAERTLVSASSLDKEIRSQRISPKIECAKKVGELLAKRSIEKGIKKVCFDRRGYRFWGRIKALATSAREGGLSF